LYLIGWYRQRNVAALTELIFYSDGNSHQLVVDATH
jgi:hypothetical protein